MKGSDLSATSVVIQMNKRSRKMSLQKNMISKSDQKNPSSDVFSKESLLGKLFIKDPFLVFSKLIPLMRLIKETLLKCFMKVSVRRCY